MQKTLVVNPPGAPYDPGSLTGRNASEIMNRLGELDQDARLVDLDAAGISLDELEGMLALEEPHAVIVLCGPNRSDASSGSLHERVPAVAEIASSGDMLGMRVLLVGDLAWQRPELFLAQSHAVVVAEGDPAALDRLVRLPHFDEAALDRIPGIIYKRDGVLTRTALGAVSRSLK